MTRKKNKNKILIYLILGLLAIIIVGGVIILLVNRNNNNNNSKITKSENTLPQPEAPSNNLPEMVSSANVSCPPLEYYDYDTNQCTSLKSTNSNCKNGVACASGVCVIREEESFNVVTSGTALGPDDPARIVDRAKCKKAATALKKTWENSYTEMETGQADNSVDRAACEDYANSRSA